MAAKGSRPPLTGWVTKRKGEGRSRLLGGSNRRFYTIDFDAQAFFYGHTEDCKSVSMPIPFRDILKAEPISGLEAEALPDAQEAALQRSDSKGSLGSRSSGMRRPRMPSLGALSRRPSTDQHGLLLHTVGKVTELSFASKAEAETWVQAFQQAISMSGGETAREGLLGQDLSTATGSSCCTATPRSEMEDSLVDGELPSARSSVRSGRSTRPSRPSSAAGLLPKAPAGDDAASFADSQSCGPQPKITRALSGALAWGYARSNSGEELNKSKCSRYADKGQGLSLQERLAQLDFSDNEEEDDDDPTAAARKPSARGFAAKAAAAASAVKAKVMGTTKAQQQPTQVTVESCEAFVLEADSDDD